MLNLEMSVQDVFVLHTRVTFIAHEPSFSFRHVFLAQMFVQTEKRKNKIILTIMN